MALSKATSFSKQRGISPELQETSEPVAASTIIYQGGIVVSLVSGYADRGKTTTPTTAVALGIAAETADNSSGAAGAVNVRIRRGCFRFKNSSAGDLIGVAQRNRTVYMVDDETAAATNASGTRIALGIVRDVDAQGVWVQVGATSA